MACDGRYADTEVSLNDFFCKHSTKSQISADVYNLIAVTRRLFYQPTMTMRLCWQVFAVGIIFLSSPSTAEDAHNPKRYPVTAKASLKPDIDMFASMTGKCSTLKIAGRDFACRSVAFFHNQHGRANFTVALDDPTDDSHIISFSGEDSRKEQENLFELSIDRMLLNSKERPKVDGLPVPLVELSDGKCQQLGSFAIGMVSSISCTAIDKNGKSYELQFESDGSPIKIRKIKQAPLRSSRQIAQLECRHKGHIETNPAQRFDRLHYSMPGRRLPRTLDCRATVKAMLAHDNRFEHRASSLSVSRQIKSDSGPRRPINSSGGGNGSISCRPVHARRVFIFLSPVSRRLW